MKIKLFTLILLIAAIQFTKSQTLNSQYDQNTGTWKITQNSEYSSSKDLLYTWLPIQTPVTNQIMRVFFVDLQHGWAGHNGNGGLLTTDGGFNWSTISFNDTNFTTLYQGVWFIDQNTGWMVGGALQIRKTTNGGLNWFKQYAPPAAGIFHSIMFIDANTGYAIGSKNYPYVPFIAKSTNGGSNWTELSDAFSGAQELNNQYWFDASTGWISGYDVLLFTSNGGQSFTNYFSNVPPTGNGANDLLSTWWVNQTTGWIGGSNLDKKNIYKTTNSGTNWVFQDNPVAQQYAYVQINDMNFMTPDSGWAINGTPFAGAIMSTTNGGTNWVTEEGSSNWFQSLSIYNRTKGWCGASSGKVWYSILTPPVGVSHDRDILPDKYSLSQNYPNPFNPATNIKYQIPKNSFVKLIVYDVLGNEKEILVNKNQNAGSYEIKFDAGNYASGIYFYKLAAGGFTETKKLILIK